MASAKDIISRAVKACGGVFRPSMDEEKASDNKSLFKVTPNGSDEVVYSFRVKIDKKKYQSLTNPGEGAGAEGGGVQKAEQTSQDEAIALDANQAVQQAMRECAATIEQCRARNKIACPYHGARIIEMDIMQRLQDLGVNAVPKVEADKDRRGRPTGTYMIQIPCMNVRAERDKVERAINEFMQTPGVAPEEGRDAENDWTDDIHELEEGGRPAESGYTSFFEVDRLDPNASSEEEAHVEEPEDEGENDVGGGEENETPREEPTTASERPGDETAESDEENAPRAENANGTASVANQEVIDYLRGQLENENLPQSVRDFLQGQLDALSPRGEESGETESPSEPREQIDWEEQARQDREFSDAIRNANWEPATSQPETTSETPQQSPEGNHARRPTAEQIREAAEICASEINRRWGEGTQTPQGASRYIRSLIDGDQPYDGDGLAYSMRGLPEDNPVVQSLRGRLSASEQGIFDRVHAELRLEPDVAQSEERQDQVAANANQGEEQSPTHENETYEDLPHSPTPMTREQESAANAETPQQNSDARESRVLHRIDDDKLNDDIAQDVMDALHGELRRAGRRKAELFAESGRDQTSPAYAAGKRFSSYERALNTILSGLPSTYRDLLTDTEAYVSREADSEETRRRPDGTTETVRGFNPETGAQTTPHKRAMDAARFVAHLIGQHVEMDANGRANFIPGVENETLPPLTFETSASHAAHRQEMQSQANANATATPPRPQPTRREFFAAPTGTEGRIDAGSERANSIRANAQNAANSARSSRVRNILSRIARPQQQPEERLD